MVDAGLGNNNASNVIGRQTQQGTLFLVMEAKLGHNPLVFTKLDFLSNNRITKSALI